MRRITYILGMTIAFLMGIPCVVLAQDTTFNRVVVVERDYQPEINQAAIIPIQPSILEVVVDPNPVVYSTYSTPLSIGYNLHPLQAAETRFTLPTPLHGLLDGALGHHNTHFNFSYQIQEKKNMSANVYAKHDAYWGQKTLSQSKLGAAGTYHFNKIDLYAGLEAGNDYYSLHGKNPTEWRALYQASAYVGLRTNHTNHLQYRVQTGYEAFLAPGIVEHQIRSYAEAYWAEGQHQGGLKAYVQNNLYTSHNDLSLSPIHNIRLQPYYELREAKVRLQIGMNLDINVGTGKMLSTDSIVSFAPSPNVKVEWLIVPKLLNLHAEIEGGLAKGTIEEGLHANRYFHQEELAIRRESKEYVPVAANVGFMVHPLRTMVIDVYGGYSLFKNAYTMFAICDSTSVMGYSYFLDDYQRGHVGASLHYHYRDMVHVKAKGNYYFWKNLTKVVDDVYDRSNWDLNLRIDAKIGKKWTLYSDNHFEGKRWADTSLGNKELPMIIDLNLGAQYTINRWLNAYLQLGNYLHRNNSIYYGYPTQGCHFLAGIKYAF